MLGQTGIPSTLLLYSNFLTFRNQHRNQRYSYIQYYVLMLYIHTLVSFMYNWIPIVKIEFEFFSLIVMIINYFLVQILHMYGAQQQK